jgi:NAD(P) transhydrogenase subunit alpha
VSGNQPNEPFPKARRVARALSLAAIGLFAAGVAAELLGAAPATVTASLAPATAAAPAAVAADAPSPGHAAAPIDYWTLATVFMLATFIGIGVIARVSRLLHTPLMSLTNAISAIAVVGSILVTGGDYPPAIRVLGAVALFASMTNIVSGFLITDRMLKMFKQGGAGAKK